MKANNLILLIAVFALSNVYAQDSSWRLVKIGEDLAVRIPRRVIQIDTTLGNEKARYGFKVFQAQTQVCTLAVTITPNGTNINADNEEALKSALDAIVKGACETAGQKGLTCKSKDSLMDNLPCKKMEFYMAGFQYPAASNYIFLVNDKMYMFTIAPLTFTSDRIKLMEESKNFLSSIHFTGTVKEKRFSTKAESIGHKAGYYLVPLVLVVLCIAFVISRIRR
jgi:hypothetical protein